MNFNPVAITTPKNVQLIDVLQSEIFSGKQAGFCYMQDSYEELEKREVAALNRFSGCSNQGHHSVAEHVYITVIIENCSKIFAMLLNSIQAYNTSEKSGRYTRMSNGELYKKWLNTFTNLFKEKYPNYSEVSISKLAQENARYVLSVFEPMSSFSYTTSLRMWNYIYNWSKKLINTISNEPKYSLFTPLADELSQLNSFIGNLIKVKALDDKKKRGFEFFTNFSDISARYESIPIGYSNYGISYTVCYPLSFCALAQAERHRTLKYCATIPDNDLNYFIPSILNGHSELISDWLSDLKTVTLPLAAKLKVVEFGNVDTFLLKCTERICGATQEEIRHSTETIFKNYYNATCNNSMDIIEQDIVRSKLEECISNKNGITYIKPKCEQLEGCLTPCQFKTDVYLESKLN